MTYNTGKRHIAGVARRLELGEEVPVMTKMTMETASWLVTKGEGMGKHIVC